MLSHARDDLSLVLVLEKDFAVRDSLKFALGLAGVSVRAFGSPVAFLEDAALPRAACLLVGHNPPVLDAFEVVSRLRARACQAPVLLITDHATASLCRRAARAGIHHVIERPVFDEALLESIKDILNRPGTEAQLSAT